MKGFQQANYTQVKRDNKQVKGVTEKWELKHLTHIHLPEDR